MSSPWWIGFCNKSHPGPDRTRLGRRKPFILAGAPLAFLGFVAIPLFVGNSLVFFMASIFLTLFAMDMFRTPVISLLGDITPSPQRSQANGMINLMGGVGGGLAFVVGGLLFKLAVGAPFYFGGVAMLAGCGVVILFIREPNPAEAGAGEEQPALLKSLKTVLRDRERSTLFLLGAIFFWFLGYGALEVFFTSFAVNRLQVDSGQATFLLAYLSLAIILFSPLSGFIGSRCGRKRTINTGIVAFATLLAYGYTMTTLWETRIVLPLCGLAWSLILVNSLPMVMDLAPANHLGVYTGLYYLSSQLSAIAGPVVSGKLIDLFAHDYRVAFLYGTVTLLLALVFMLPVKRGEAVWLPA